MKVWRQLDNLPVFKNAILTIGTFDGVHLGHQKIINQLKQVALVYDGETVIVTFHPHPRKIIQHSGPPFHLLNTLSEKLHLLEMYGIDHVIVVPFDDNFAAQTAESYVKEFLVNRIHPHTIIIGYDHHFGKDRTGNYQTLERYGLEFGFQVKEIPEKILNEVTISSTKIREALLQGEAEKANRFLGHNYHFSGRIEKGQQLGRTLGYPTANINVPDEDKLIPSNGVYAVRVKLPDLQILGGMLNIGNRPTIAGGLTKTIEVNIFDFDQDIYHQHIEIELVHKMREELKFPSLEALKEQLAKDKLMALKLL